MSGINISEHARLRSAQRNLKEDDLAFVIRYGQKIRRTGVSFFFLGDKDIPEDFAREKKRLAGATVVVEEQRVATVYRNKRALRKIKRKSKLKYRSGRRRRPGRRRRTGR